MSGNQQILVPFLPSSLFLWQCYFPLAKVFFCILKDSVFFKEAICPFVSFGASIGNSILMGIPWINSAFFYSVFVDSLVGAKQQKFCWVCNCFCPQETHDQRTGGGRMKHHKLSVLWMVVIQGQCNPLCWGVWSCQEKLFLVSFSSSSSFIIITIMISDNVCWPKKLSGTVPISLCILAKLTSSYHYGYVSSFHK